MNFLMSILEQGLIYGIMALGVYITYKILDFPDLGVDSTFPLGAAVTAALIQGGMNPYLTLVVSFAAGMAAGVCTGLIHVKLKVRDLLSGIIVMTGLYNINLFIAGTNNVPLFSEETIFKNHFTDSIFQGKAPRWWNIAVILVIVLICKILLDIYMKTQSGYLLRAVGDNDVIVTSLAKDKGNIKILGLAISNGLVSLSGCVFAQQSRVFDISMGTGSLVIGLASVIIGISFFKKASFMKTTTAVVIGSIIYKACVALALKVAGDKATKLITALLFLVILVIGMDRKKKVKVNA